MSKPPYASHSQMELYFKDPRAYYLKYMMSGERIRIPQTQAMAVGSAFDAYIKNYLYKEIMGTLLDPDLFVKQVESQNRDFARKAGMDVFSQYIATGMAADLLAEMSRSPIEPVFEGRVERVIEGIPIVGYPDLTYQNTDGIPVIRDWKVNGYLSSASPVKGYCLLRPSASYTGRMSQRGRASDLEVTGGIVYSGGGVPDKWHNQVCLYGWLLGVPVGALMLLGIEQIVCSPKGMRFARYTGYAREQDVLIKRWHTFWDDTEVVPDAEMLDVAYSDPFFRAMHKSEKRW